MDYQQRHEQMRNPKPVERPPCSHDFNIRSRGIKGQTGIRMLCGKCGHAEIKSVFGWKVYNLLKR
jgi:hypothetical protein